MTSSVLAFPASRLGGGLAFADAESPAPVGHLDVAPVSFLWTPPSLPMIAFVKPTLTAGIDGHDGAFGGAGLEAGIFAGLGNDAQVSVSLAGVGYATTRGVRGGAVLTLGKSIFGGFVAYHADAALFRSERAPVSHQISVGAKFGF